MPCWNITKLNCNRTWELYLKWQYRGPQLRVHIFMWEVRWRDYPWSTISAPSFVSASSIFATLNPSGESSVPMSRRVWSGIGFCDNQNGLLQLYSGSTSSIVNRSTATCPECGSQSHYWHRNTRTYHSCASESALAADLVSHNIQTVRTYTSGAHRLCSCLPVWHGNGNRRSVRSRKAQIFEHFPIWTSIIEAQVRREKLLLHRT